MASVGRPALTLQHTDLSQLAYKYRMVSRAVQLKGVPSEVVLLFAERLDIKECGCWHWSGDREDHKYARFHPGKQWASSANSLAHRFSVALFTGEVVPRDKVVDHLCADRSCVAPWHLNAISFAENVRLGQTRTHAGKACSPSYCPPSAILPKGVGPADDRMMTTVELFEALRAKLVTPLEDERKLFAFAAHIDPTGTPATLSRGAEGSCWEWQGARTNDYGKLTWKQVKGETRSAHRWAYTNFVADIPQGLVVDHICENPPCVRPEHLRAVTYAENNAASSIAPSALNSRKTHCDRGHEFSPENTIIIKRGKSTTRQCRVCSKLRAEVYQQRQKTGTQTYTREKDKCRHGHEFTPENTAYTGRGVRQCRTCVAEKANKRYRAKRDAGVYRHPRKPGPSA